MHATVSIQKKVAPRLPLAVSLIGGLMIWACGGEEITTGPGGQQPAAQTVASVAVTQSTATLVSLGETVQLTASARDASGNAISDKAFTWSSSDASIATVSSSGLVTAVANGSVTITATTDGINGTAAVDVNQATASVAVTPASATLVSLGETAQLTASAQEANGTAISGRTFAWSSSNEAIATVSASGLVTAVVDGSVTITVTTDGVSGTAGIAVDQTAVLAAPAISGTPLIGNDAGTNTTTLHLGTVEDGGDGERGTGGAGGAGRGPSPFGTSSIGPADRGAPGGKGGDGGNGGNAGDGRWTITGSFTNQGTVTVGGSNGSPGSGGGAGVNGGKGGDGSQFGNGFGGDDAAGFSGSGGTGGILFGAVPTNGVNGGGGGGGQSTVAGANGGQGVGGSGANGANGVDAAGDLETLTTSGTFANGAAGFIEIGPSGGNGGNGADGGNGGGGGGGGGGGFLTVPSAGGAGGLAGGTLTGPFPALLPSTGGSGGSAGNGEIIVGANGVFTNQNLAEVKFGSIFGLFRIQSGGKLDNQTGGTITLADAVNMRINGTVVNNGTIVAPSGITDLENLGTFRGSGTVTGNFLNRGVFAPGNSPDRVQSIVGRYLEVGTLRIEIGGLTAGTEYDFVDVAGDVAVAGVLDLSFVDGFDHDGLSIGDEFDIIQYTGTILGFAGTGTFSSVNQSAVFPAIFAVDYTNDGSITLRVVEIIETDVDGDGIVDLVDILPADFSNGFSDGDLGGSTTGDITARGDRDWLVKDEPDDSNTLTVNEGVRIEVGSGSPGAQITGAGSCIPNTVVNIPTAGSEFVFSCGSTTVQVIEGPVESVASLDGLTVTVTVDAGQVATFSLTDGALQVTNVGTGTLSGNINGEQFSLTPGESILVEKTPFAEFVIEEAELELDDEAEWEEDEFEVEGSFVLGDANNGIDVLNEDVTVVFGTFSHTVSAGLFVRDDDDEGFEFDGTLPDGTRLKVEIDDDGEFEVEGEDLDLSGNDPNGSVFFSLQIGGDFGETTITLHDGEFELEDDDEDEDDDDDDHDD